MLSQHLILPLLFIARYIQSVRVGSISNVTLLSSSATITSMNLSCSNCICRMISTNNILGVICTENQNCSLFHDYSFTYTINFSPDSSFYFLSLPREQIYSTENSFTNTNTSKCGTCDQTPSEKIISVSSMMNSSTIHNIRHSWEYLSEDRSPHSTDCCLIRFKPQILSHWIDSDGVGDSNCVR